MTKTFAEFDEVGRDAFLRLYGFRPGRGSHIWHDGVAYDAKAVCAAAHGKLGRGFKPLTPFELGTGDKAVTRKLQALGFEIVGPFHLTIRADDGTPLDSSCELHRLGSGFTLTLHSRGGAKGTPAAANTDYLNALALVVGRLCSLGATLDDVILDTTKTRHLPESGRRLIPDCPRLLRPSTSVQPIVSAITKAATNFKATATKGGNPTKQIQIRFSAPRLRDVDDVRAQVVGGGRRLFVLTWAHTRDGIDPDDVQHRIETTATGGVVADSWSTGNRKSGIAPGDHLVLLRRGRKRGIVAHGIATTGVYLDARHGATGGTANFIGLVWDSWVSVDDRLTVETLNRITSSTNWDSMQGSGILVHGVDASAVLTAWRRMNPGGPLPLNGDEVVGGLPEGARKTVTVNRYERNREARAKCLAAHGYACKVCGIDFAHDYGGIADGYIHVHHIVPIASIGKRYELDPLTDLVPVCPNCHAMLHHGVKEPRTVAELRRILARTP